MQCIEGDNSHIFLKNGKSCWFLEEFSHFFARKKASNKFANSSKQFFYEKLINTRLLSFLKNITVSNEFKIWPNLKCIDGDKELTEKIRTFMKFKRSGQFCL